MIQRGNKLNNLGNDLLKGGRQAYIKTLMVILIIFCLEIKLLGHSDRFLKQQASSASNTPSVAERNTLYLIAVAARSGSIYLYIYIYMFKHIILL